MAPELPEQQKERMSRLLDKLGQASIEEIARALEKREPIEPEPGLTTELERRLRQRLEAKSAS